MQRPEVEATFDNYEGASPVIPLVAITPLDLMTARFEALRAVFSAALAQVLGGDALTAKAIFTRLNEDVERETSRFLQMLVQARASQEEE